MLVFMVYDFRGDKISKSSAKQVHNNENCNSNGRIADYWLWVIVLLKGKKKQLEILVTKSCREIANKNKISNNKEKIIRMLEDVYEQLERELADNTV
ncbi:2947_t:CDS:1, partial [Racocetra persica]